MYTDCVTVKLQEMVLLSRVCLRQAFDIFIKRRLVQSSLAHIEDLLGLAVMRSARLRMKDALAKERLFAKHNY
jgi:hypothetical protein